MRFPQCHSQAINFLTWIHKYNAFKTNCKHCGASLKANAMVYISFIITILVTLSLLPYLDDIFNYLEIELEYKKLKVLALLPVMLLGGISCWLLGGYKADK